ncbi:hypothetical protein BE221DRAFT_174971 [Ostreococcus tauri]|uniref:Tetratricopeptide repeat n=1 Tax=Ostreococcus tauri TaxID=70448 RepID=A0A1Y5I2H0_OSTTA|nr:hypothetical protein BE221DRAFT_174971 [Ostreococcus tauri]
MDGAVCESDFAQPDVRAQNGADRAPWERERALNHAIHSGDDFERQFKEFCQRPENAPVVAEHQRQELRKLDRVHHRCDAMEFRDAVLSADEEAQRNVAPFLRTRVLRTLWANNPRVIEMLKTMQEAIDEGRVTETDVEQTMANLETKDLVGALNEQLTLRFQGNDLYKARQFDEAHQAYTKALGIMNLVKARIRATRKRYGRTMKLFGEAIGHLDEYLLTDPENVRIVMRRGRAHAGRGDFIEAKRDFSSCVALNPFDFEAQEALDALRRDYRADVRRRKDLAKKYVKGLGQ